MTEQEIIRKWKQGLSKDKLSKIYKREYNMNVRNIRAMLIHRHNGRFITSYEALAHVEGVIYRYIRLNNRN